MNIPKIGREHAKQYSGEWLFHGKIAVALDDCTFDFAADFANAILQTVFAQVIAEQEAAKKALVVAQS